MKVGILAASNIRYSPYLFPYVELLKRLGMEYALIYPDRLGVEDPYEGESYRLDWKKGGSTTLNYLHYARKLIRIVRREKYDALIVLTAPLGSFLAPWLALHYRKRYILDIRDYSHEDNPVYFALETMAVHNSLLNVISSRRFETFLPKGIYHCCHNYGTNAHTIREHFTPGQDPLTIGYVGLLSYGAQCKKMMALVAEDPRFKMDFYGTSDLEPELKEYAASLPEGKITFHGAYAPGQKDDICRKVDILFNAYGNDHPLVSCLLANKLYDSFLFKKPILTSPDTYMHERAGYLSWPIDLERETSLDGLYSWYRGLEKEKVEDFADRAMAECVREHEKTLSLVGDLLKGLKR